MHCKMAPDLGESPLFKLSRCRSYDVFDDLLRDISGCVLVSDRSQKRGGVNKQHHSGSHARSARKRFRRLGEPVLCDG